MGKDRKGTKRPMAANMKPQFRSRPMVVKKKPGNIQQGPSRNLQILGVLQKKPAVVGQTLQAPKTQHNGPPGKMRPHRTPK